MRQKHWISAVSSLALVSTVLAPVTVTAQGRQGVTAATQHVRLVIETSRTTYRVGDSIAVRLRFVNDGLTPITFVHYPPWLEASFTITDATGRVVAPAHGPADAYLVSSRRVTLPVGEARVRSWANQEWFDLRYWGYGPLGPGQYTVVGVPLVVVSGASPDSTSRSHGVTISIAP